MFAGRAANVVTDASSSWQAAAPAQMSMSGLSSTMGNMGMGSNLPSNSNGVNPMRNDVKDMVTLAMVDQAVDEHELHTIMDEPDVYVPMDGENRIFESTHDLDERLADREFTKREHNDYVTLGDVEGEMDELRTDKDQEEVINTEIKKVLETMALETLKSGNEKGGEKRIPLDAHRICQIENRLKNDRSLRSYDDDDRVFRDSRENAAETVKHNLIRTYNKIRRSAQGEVSQYLTHQLDDKIAILKKL